MPPPPIFQQQTELTEIRIPNGTKDVSEKNVDSMESADGIKKTEIVYGIEDNPPWYMCILLGMQVSLSGWQALSRHLSLSVYKYPTRYAGPFFVHSMFSNYRILLTTNHQ